MSNKKDHVYGVLGSGDVNPKIVLDGLLDANENAEMFLIHARRNPQGAVTSVYDFLADNEVTFTAYHRVDDNPPKALVAMADSAPRTDDPAREIITALSRSGGTLLLLWDDENPQHSEKFAIMASDAGVPIKDLSDGLAPIVVDTSPQEPVEEEAEEVEETVTAFSRDELLNMNIGVLRRQAKSLGLDSVGRVTKEEIVDLILGTSTPAPVTEGLQESMMAVVTWYEAGSMQVVTVPVEKVRPLLS